MFLPFLNGPEFLGVFVTLWVLFLAGTWFAAFLLKRKALLTGEILPDLKPVELAYLASGPAAAVNVSIIRLGALGHFKTDDSRSIVRTEVPAKGLSSMDETIANLAQPGESLKPDAVRAATKEFLDPVRVRLEDLGLLVPSASQSWFFKGFWLVALFLVAFGVIRGISGLVNEKPSAFIWILTVVFPLLSLVFLGLIHSPRTLGGNQLLASLKKQNAELKTGAHQLNDPDHADRMALAVALFGVMALGTLSANPWARALLPFQPVTSSGGGDYISSSCSDGGSSSSSDGGGGGGGGCGGCGGGGGD